MFLDESDQATQTAFAQVAQHVASTALQMKAGAIEEFLDGADPWLIAKAMTINATVVTHVTILPPAHGTRRPMSSMLVASTT